MNLSSLKKLARSNKYQLLYTQAKELSNISIFKNNGEFTKIQLLFLNWLNVYNMLLSDLAMKEKNISEEVIDDDLRMEAYLVYKEHIRKYGKKDKDNNKVKPSDIPTVIFTNK